MTEVNTYDRWSPGTLFEGGGTSLDYWIKPEQNASYHLEGMLINLFTGQVVHHSHVDNLTPTYGFNIQW
jgi:hypothetical protein